jgi:response regulator RpfG family c-di-GMP phosphodiesterase
MAVKPPHSLLIVHDESAVIDSLTQLLQKEGYQVHSALSAQDGLSCLSASGSSFSLIICNQQMPEMTGSRFFEKAKDLAPDAMRILLSDPSDGQALIEAINQGQIYRCLAKPVNDADLLQQVRTALHHYEVISENRRLAESIRQQNEEFKQLNQDLAKKVTERNQLLLKKQKELDGTLMGAFRLISSLVEMLSPALGEYLIHVGQLARDVAQAFDLPGELVNQIELAGLFHDIGLIGMPESVLAKDKSHMAPDEYTLYIQHPLLISIFFQTIPQLSEVSRIILSHHENYDGTGYPHGLAGEEIPLGARIIAVVSDYCRILDTWPADPKQIRQKAIARFGPQSVEALADTDSDAYLAEIAERALLLGAGNRYDMKVVEKLEKCITRAKLQPPGMTDVPVEELQEGMILARPVVLQDGFSLMSKGIRLNRKLIDSLAKIKAHGKLGDPIYILTS